jgi:hypothetical protein
MQIAIVVNDQRSSRESRSEYGMINSMDIATLENNQADILARSIDSQKGGLSIEAAEFIASLELTHDDEQRMIKLSELAQRGNLTEFEERELDEFRRCGRLIEMLKLKARKVLQTK